MFSKRKIIIYLDNVNDNLLSRKFYENFKRNIINRAQRWFVDKKYYIFDKYEVIIKTPDCIMSNCNLKYLLDIEDIIDDVYLVISDELSHLENNHYNLWLSDKMVPANSQIYQITSIDDLIEMIKFDERLRDENIIIGG